MTSSPGVVILRLDGGLFFATSDAMEDRAREVALSTPGILGIVLDCEGIEPLREETAVRTHNQPGLGWTVVLRQPAHRPGRPVHDADGGSARVGGNGGCDD